MFLFVSFVFGLVLLTFLWDFLNKRKTNEAFAKAHLTGPKEYPLFGCIAEALHIKPENMIDVVGDLFRKYGKTFRFWILGEAQLYTTDITIFESILSSTTVLKKADLYKFLVPFLNDGLLLSNGRKWHGRRKIFTTAFHFKVLENYVNIFDKQSGILVDQLKPLADGKTEIEVMGKICLAALDVITEAAMGVSCNAQSDPNFPYVKALKSVVYIQPNRMFSPKKRYDWLYKILCPNEYKKLTADIKIMQDFTINVIERRRADLEASLQKGTYKPLNSADDDIGSRSQMAFLDILLQSQIDGKPLTNEEIREEVDTFMFEGDDTTTSCVSHALYLIARHPDIQRKIIHEIHQVIGKDKNSPVSMQQLTDLKYLECVVKETLRIYPSVPAVGRKADHDITINGMTIPANTSIYMVLLWAHRDPEYFPDPESFKPERFLEEEQKTIKGHAFSFVPFSAGPRNCIGQKFAMLEVKSLISKVLRHYELLPLGPDNQAMMNFIVRSSTGFHLGLQPRT